MNNAIYVVNIGTEDSPLSRMGVCALADVPKDAVFVVTSPDAEKIISLAIQLAPSKFTKQISAHEVDIGLLAKYVIAYIRAACDVSEVGEASLKFKYEIAKSTKSPYDRGEFDKKWADAFNEQACKITSAIHDAIGKAAEDGAELESVFFGGEFAVMSGKPKFIYKVECHADESVVVGGEMSFEQDQPGSVLRVSEKEIRLCGADGCNGSTLVLNTQCEPQMVAAIVAFFARCYKKRM